MRLKLLAFSMVLLALPWLGWRYLQEMQDFLLEGHQHAQQLTARALATVMEAHPQAFGSGAEDTGQPQRYAAALAEFPLLDGYFGDWQPLADELTAGGDDSDALFRWLPGTWQDNLYLLVRVEDPQRVYRHPGAPRLDTSDHLRLRVLDGQGQPLRLTVSSEGSGEARIERVGRDWRYPLYGAPRLPVSAWWQEVNGGYQVELRLPLDWGRSLALAVVDVDDPAARVVERLQWSPERLPGQGHDSFRILSRSPDLQAILRRDWQVAGVVTVVDRQRWVVAASEGAGDVSRLPQQRVGDALRGAPGVWIAPGSYSVGQQLVSSWPVRSQGEVIGAVVVSQALDELSASQWQSFIGITLATLAVLVIVVVGLLLFATRIAWRIRRLGRETAKAIDAEGRIRATRIKAEANAGDEFGELSRRISAMLQRLQRFTGFLEGIPRTLRHEINNPLNTISTSLQNLVDTRPELADDRYQQAAAHGVERLERIVNSLTEAAGLEQSLHGDPAETFDLAVLVNAYAASAAASNPGLQIIYHGPDQGMPISGSDFRIEQLLDKLVDNAVDFTPAGGAITLALKRGGPGYMLLVSNDGPALPEVLCGQQFDSMVSVRDRHGDDRPHLGMGLFIARAIAEHHGGTLQAGNRADGGGVEMRVSLAACRT